MAKIDEKQKKRLERFARFQKGGLAAQFIEINELAESFEELEIVFKEAMKNIKGDIGRPGKDGKIGPMGARGMDGKDGKLGPQGPRGENGKDGVAGPAGPKGADGRDGSPDSAFDIRNKLELLEGDERLDAKYIRGLSEHIRTHNKETNDDILMRATAILDQRTSFLINKLYNLQNQVNALPSGGSVVPWNNITLNGGLTYSVSFVPNEVNSDGTILFGQNGYTYNAGQITFVNPPQQFAGYR